MSKRARWVGRVAGVIAMALASGGCETRDPNKPLNEDEGAALLRDVRAGKKGVGDLTQADRVFLKRKMAR